MQFDFLYKRLMRSLIGLILLVGLLLSPRVTAEQDQVGLVADDNGRQIDLTEGQPLVITLESNPSTGYSWQVEGMDAAILRPVGEPVFESTSDLLGAPGKQVLRFQALGAGEADLDLVYRRPWEMDVPPAKTFSVHVRGVGTFSRLVRPVDTHPNPVEQPAPIADQNVQSVETLPPSYNWCDLGGCTPVKNQGSCGSCWAFSTVGPLEANIKIRDGVTDDLSEQYLISCNSNGWSCSGGWTAHDYHLSKYITGESGPGAVHESDFPYQAANVACNPPHPHQEKLTSWRYVPGYPQPSIAAIKQAIYDYGPVGASVCVGSAFQRYKSDVFQTDESGACPANNPINHGIVLVGWDDSQQAWILRNSWGASWGQQGYMRIRWGTSKVGYAAHYVVYGGPKSPTSLSAKSASQTQINLTWTDNSADEAGFKIERSSEAITWTQVITVSANITTTSDTDLTCNSPYYYRVRAYKESNYNSDYGNTASAVTSACSALPDAPGPLAAAPASQSQINLTWTDNSSNESGFKIERSPDGTSNWTQIYTTTANITSYANAGLNSLTTYYYRLRAYNTSGNSGYSSVAHASTLGQFQVYLPVTMR